MKESKPGVLSAELLNALGMTDRTSAPPPWLINMQRYGPPPSYPTMRIPGLNAPIPAGASFGYHLGGWGKPPVDEYGRPLYGDVFGLAGGDEEVVVEVDKSTRWGELIELEVEEEEEEVEDEEGMGGYDASGVETPMTMDGTTTISGIETPDTIMDLRKRAGLDTPDSSVAGGGSRDLYRVIQEKANLPGQTGGQLFGSDRTYVIPGKGDVQVSLNPDDLEESLKDKDKLRDVYDSQLGENVEENEEVDAQTGTKRRRRVDGSVAAKRIKDFKF